MKNLLLLGDSIRMGYDSFVKEKLEGRMNVYFSEDNGRFAQYTMRTLGNWKDKLALPKIHVVHWNNGLWDLLHLNACPNGNDGEAEGETMAAESDKGKYLVDKDPVTPPEIYRYMIGRVLTRIRQLFPGAEVVFATTTPVIEELAPGSYRSNREVDLYNRIACEVLTPRGVRINDLCEFSRRKCAELHRDWVHYTEEGSRLLADEIVQYLEKENLL